MFCTLGEYCGLTEVKKITFTFKKVSESQQGKKEVCLGLSGLHIKLPFGNATPLSLNVWAKVQAKTC